MADREPVCIDASTCARNHIINFHLSSFFRGFFFAEAGLSAKITKICTQRKFPAIRYSSTLKLWNLCWDSNAVVGEKSCIVYGNNHSAVCCGQGEHACWTNKISLCRRGSLLCCEQWFRDLFSADECPRIETSCTVVANFYAMLS